MINKKNIKDYFKSIPFIFKLNAVYKCKKTKIQYQKIIDYYNEKHQEYSFIELLKQKGIDNSWAKKFENRKPRVFYLGTDEFQDKSGFLQALSKFSEITFFTKEDGDYGQYKRSKNVIELNSKRLIKLFKELDEKKKRPDILLMQTWAWRIGAETLLLLKENYQGLKVINISMDDRHTFFDNGNPSNGVFGLIPALDLALTSAPEAVDWYLKEKIPSLYFPEASSLDFFHPINIEKKYDVGFVGSKYGIREEIVEEVRKSGVSVECYGKGWKNGMLPIEDINKFFNSCKIILGVGTIGYCRDFYALKLRDFDAPLSGSCYVTHNNSDLNILYDEDAIVKCEDVKSYVNKINMLLKDEEKIAYIAKKGFIQAKSSHTYEKRIEFLFSTINIVIND